jgi:hypothetical protein
MKKVSAAASEVRMRRFALALLVLPLVLAGAFAGWLAAHCRDLPGFDDADLQVERLALAPGADAYDLLDQATQALAWPAEDTWMRDAFTGEPGTRARVAALVSANERALELVDVALATPQLQVPESALARGDLRDMLGWRRVVTLLCLRAWLDGETRNTSVALEGFVRAAELGKRMAEARGGTLAHMTTGLAARDESLRALRQFADRSPIEDEDARRTIAALGRLEIDAAAWRRAWYAEHRAARDRQLVLLRTPLLSERALAGARAPGQDELGRLLAWIPEGFVAQPNRTMDRLASLTRRFAAEPRDACLSDAPLMTALDTAEPAPLRAYLLPNGLGEVWIDRFERGSRAVVARRCGADARLAGTRVHLALRAYHSDRGELPHTLDALVPTYLTAVPRDPFGGAPLRYSRERRLVWSIGRDGHDVGGLPDLGASDVREVGLEEPTFALAFGAPLGEPPHDPIEAARR